MKPKGKIDSLLARPSWLAGIARFFDFAGSFDRYNVRLNDPEADAMAIYSDWLMVGSDLVEATERLETDNDLQEAA